MKFKLILLSAAALLLGWVGAYGNAKTPRSFAIVVDSASYAHCKAEIDDYAGAVSAEGLRTLILSDNWKTPEQVKDQLLRLYKDDALEGAVFVGEIPIPMVRKAQHLTSAFKMDEESSTLNETSVPSDRFYDDFDLKFNFLCADPERSDLFYYELAPQSPQYILSDIYTGRICPKDIYCDRYEELGKYLRKVVAAKKAVAEANPEYKIDKVMSYTGEGSFSNSLIAWKDETITLREQFPDIIDTKEGVKHYIYAMFPFVKDVVSNELQRPDLDLALFHEHGMPDRQYLSAVPAAGEEDEYFERAKYSLRESLRLNVSRGKSRQEAVSDITGRYGVDSTWLAGAFDPKQMEADSLLDLKTGLVLDDIHALAPNAKITVFDACYNGDFREPDCIASRYVLSDGGALVGIGNSVNVLQDKSSSDLLGMLSAGYRVGEWMMQVNILESHILGDPTFRFVPSFGGELPELSSKDCEYWLGYLDETYPVDIRGLALHKLHALGYKGMSDLLLQTYKSSDSYMLRLQCMHLSAEYYDGNYASLLKLAADDPYEFIRRKTAFYMGKVGSDDLAPALAGMYLQDYNARRIVFNVASSSCHFAKGVFEDAFQKAVDAADFLYDKAKFTSDALAAFSPMCNIEGYTEEAVEHSEWKDRSRLIYIAGMRNNPYPQLAGKMVGIVKNDAESETIRVKVAEVLGWYVRAYNRGEIYSSLSEYLESGVQMPQSVRDEVTKTLGRLSVYMKK